MAKIVEAKTAEEFEQAKKDATGEVVLEFVDMKNCGACQLEAPKVEKFMNGCASDVTLIRVPVDMANGATPGDKLADQFNVDALPGLLYAKTGAELTPEDAKPVDDSSALKKLIKCKR